MELCRGVGQGERMRGRQGSSILERRSGPAPSNDGSKDPLTEVGHWSTLLQVFPESIQSRRIAVVILIAFFAVYTTFVLSRRNRLSECFPAEDVIRMPCNMLLASCILLALLLLAWSAALLMPPRVHRAAHTYAPHAMSVGWCLTLCCTLAAHWARWSDSGVGEHLAGLRMDNAPISRHVERSLGVAVYVPLSLMCTMGPSSTWAPLIASSAAQAADALVILGTDWRYSEGVSDAEYALAACAILVIFAVVGCTVVYFVRPGFVESSWSALRDRVPCVTGALGALLRPLTKQGLMPLGTAAYWALLVLVMVESSSAVTSMGVPRWGSLLLSLCCVALVRVTGRSVARSATQALENALTRDVVETVMERAFQHPSLSAHGPPSKAEVTVKERSERRTRLSLTRFEGGSRGGVRKSGVGGRKSGAAKSRIGARESRGGGRLEDGNREDQVSGGRSSLGWAANKTTATRRVHDLRVATDGGGSGEENTMARGGPVEGMEAAHAEMARVAARAVSSTLSGAVFLDVDAWRSAIEEPVLALPYMRECERATVIFTDIVGYTSMSSGLPPRVVLRMLHTYFARLDATLDMTGAFKYQTIGDAYCVVCGWPDPDPGHALTALKTAYAMIKVAQSVPMPLGKGTAFFTTPKHVPGPSQGSRGGADGRRGMQWRDEGHGGAAMDEAEDAADGCETGGCGVGSSGELETLQIRVGIHTGPIAASTLGFKRNCLTLVGDTLNMASRMETNSRPGHIRISEATYAELPDVARRCMVKEEIDVKGKGRMVTYCVSVEALDKAQGVDE